MLNRLPQKFIHLVAGFALAMLGLSSANSGSLTVTASPDLNFGSFIPSGNGALVLEPNGNIRVSFGSLIPTGGEQAGGIFIQGSSFELVTIELNAFDLVHVNNADHRMNLFSPRIAETGQGQLLVPANRGRAMVLLSNSGEGHFSVGASLDVSENQMPGNYEGRIEITVTGN